MIVWIVDIGLIVAGVALVRLLHGVVVPAQDIKGTVAAIKEAAPLLRKDADTIPDLLETQHNITRTKLGLARYAAALGEIL